MTAKVDRFLSADDLAAEPSWRLLRWCHARGASEFTLSPLSLEGLEAAYHDRFRALLRPFQLPSAPREHAASWRAGERVPGTELWALTRRTIELLAGFFDDGLFTYPADCLEDPTFYRDGELMLGIVSHEREGVLRLSAAEHHQIQALGIPARAEPMWI